jgi:acetyl esterase/lipase
MAVRSEFKDHPPVKLIACVLVALMCPSAHSVSPFLTEVGLIDDGANPALRVASSCDGVVFTRDLKYAEDAQNVLDVASPNVRPQPKVPVLLFVANERFDAASDGNLNSVIERAMCFAANSGMVAVKVSYRAAPGARWPAGAKDVADAISWAYENADLFGGDKDQIIPVGYRAGASHVASFLAHKELQDNDAIVAGAVLVSGIYWPSKADGQGEEAYFGSDDSKFADGAVVSGLSEVPAPIILAWSRADPPGLIDQGTRLSAKLCAAGHCPREAILTSRASPTSVFDLEGADDTLHEKLSQLVGQIRVRGLP